MDAANSHHYATQTVVGGAPQLMEFQCVFATFLLPHKVSVPKWQFHLLSAFFSNKGNNTICPIKLSLSLNKHTHIHTNTGISTNLYIATVEKSKLLSSVSIQLTILDLSLLDYAPRDLDQLNNSEHMRESILIYVFCSRPTTATKTILSVDDMTKKTISVRTKATHTHTAHRFVATKTVSSSIHIYYIYIYIYFSLHMHAQKPF